VEIMMVLVIISVLLAIAAPSFQRATEQVQCNVAAANLQAVWAAQRFYWLENHQYSANFPNLGDMVDPSISAAATPYVYSIQIIDNNTFSVSATRTGNSKWGGQLVIDQTGVLTGVIQTPGQQDIVPGLQ
jgi:Tfp pilus assembly protein PilE